MLAANYSSVRNNLKDYLDTVVDNNETLIVTRKADRNVVIISLESYNAMQKELRNAQYLSKLKRSFDQLDSGNGIMHDLIDD